MFRTLLVARCTSRPRALTRIFLVAGGRLACEQQTHFRSSLLSLLKIVSAISSCKTISVTSVFLHQSEFGSYFCGANTRGLYVALRGDLDIRDIPKMAEDGESSLDHAFVKVCDIFGFEKLNKHQEEAIRQVAGLKVDEYVNLPTRYGKSVVLPCFGR